MCIPSYIIIIIVFIFCVERTNNYLYFKCFIEYSSFRGFEYLSMFGWLWFFHEPKTSHDIVIGIILYGCLIEDMCTYTKNIFS